MKKMKVLFILVVILGVTGTNIKAQGRYGKDSAECVNNLNFYKDYLKQKNYEDAVKLWRKAFQYCPPTASQNLFIDGRKIYQQLLIKSSGNTTLRNGLFDTLMLIHKVRGENFPKYKKAVAENKAYDMLNYYKGEDNEKVFEAIEDVIGLFGEETKIGLLVAYMEKAKELYMDKKISDDEVLKIYTELSPIIDAKIASDPSEENRIAQKVFENAFVTSGVASCENLIAVFTPRFEANPTDLNIIKPIVKLLSDSCATTDLFLKAVTAMHQLDPSYNSSYYLYKLNSSRDNNQEALKYLQEAIDSEDSDSNKDGELLVEMATYLYVKSNNSARAVQVARSAIDKNAKVAGKANLLIGNIWANQRCSGNEIDSRAKYWVAVDYLLKAKSADSSLSDEVDKLVATYRQYFPKGEDAFMYDLVDGKSYTVSCGGLSATTTVRTNK